MDDLKQSRIPWQNGHESGWQKGNPEFPSSATGALGSLRHRPGALSTRIGVLDTILSGENCFRRGCGLLTLKGRAFVWPGRRVRVSPQRSRSLLGNQMLSTAQTVCWLGLADGTWGESESMVRRRHHASITCSVSLPFCMACLAGWLACAGNLRRRRHASITYMFCVSSILPCMPRRVACLSRLRV